MELLFDYNINELNPTGRWLIKRKAGRNERTESPILEFSDYLYIECTKVDSSMLIWYSELDLNLIEVNS